MSKAFNFLNSEQAKTLSQFQTFLKNHLEAYAKAQRAKTFKGQALLSQALEYSFGGKCFRPLLTFATGEYLGIKARWLFPWAGAIEIAHTASLIHDDLPAMDNSLKRRGKATSHRLFGEDIALLAGDLLWIEAFNLISTYSPKEGPKNNQINNPKTSQIKSAWLSILCKALGFNGLMGGQVLDLRPPKTLTTEYWQKMHEMKTGLLITVSIEGVLPLLSNLKPSALLKEKAKRVKQAGKLLGRAFQIADDLQDEQEESQSFTQFLGQKKSQKILVDLSEEAKNLLNFPEKDPSASFLKELVNFNQTRALP